MLGKNGSQTKKPFAQKEIHLRGTITRLIIFGVVAIVCFILNKNGVHLYKFVKPQEGEAVKESTTLMFYISFISFCVTGYSLAALLTIIKIRSRKGTGGEVSMITQLFKVVAVITGLVGITVIFGKFSQLATALSAFAGMMLGWSLQAPVSGIAAWVLVTITRPYKIGDRIQLPSYGLTGDIVKFSPLYLSLNQVGGSVAGEEPSGRILHVPNAVLFSAIVVNSTYQQKEASQAYILDEVIFRVTLDSDWDTVESIILNAARKATAEIIKATGKEPYVRAETWDYGTIFRVRYMTDATDRPKYMHQIVKTATKEFQRNKNVDLTIPYLYSFKRGSATKRVNELDRIENIPVSQISGGDIPLERIQLEHQAEIESITKSIMTKGLIQPIVVRRSTKAPDKYIIMFGEKRFLACRRLGWERIPCIVNNPLGTELSPPPDLSDIVEHHPPERSEPYDTGDFGQEPENHT
jgi:small-conductance mechanosensitive channel